MTNDILQQRQWWVTAATLVAAALIFFLGHGSQANPGQPTTYVVTVVPGDALGLACASSVSIGSRRCAYDDRQQASGVERPLRPYVTVGRELVLLSGVFESPQVQEWLTQARRANDDARVTLTCRGKWLGSVATTAVRWAPDGQFQPEHDVMSAEVSDCAVQR
jgi:hypothetical protein